MSDWAKGAAREVARKYPKALMPILSEEQESAVKSLLDKKDTMIVLPTGAGKSWCYKAVGLLTPDCELFTTLIVCPLLSIMNEESNRIKGYDLPVYDISSNNPDLTISSFKNFCQTAVKKPMYVFISPEALAKPKWRRAIFHGDHRVGLIAVDEGHCVTEWGKDFRPSYREIGDARSLAPKATMCVLTGTCTVEIQKDLETVLGLSKNYTIITRSLDRPNLYLQFEDCSSTKKNFNKLQWLCEYIAFSKNEEKKVIIFLNDPLRCADLSEYLCGELRKMHVNMKKVAMFHGDTLEGTKAKLLTRFSCEQSPLRCVIATCALGMGVNIPNIGIIVHWGCPKSPLEYWQEIGRCAREKCNNGIAIAYAPKNQFLEILKVDLKDCIRKTLLKSLVLNGQKPPALHKNCCKAEPCISCTCDYCICCIVCKRICQCKDKVANVTAFAV